MNAYANHICNSGGTNSWPAGRSAIWASLREGNRWLRQCSDLCMFKKSLRSLDAKNSQCLRQSAQNHICTCAVVYKEDWTQNYDPGRTFSVSYRSDSTYPDRQSCFVRADSRPDRHSSGYHRYQCTAAYILRCCSCTHSSDRTYSHLSNKFMRLLVTNTFLCCSKRTF